MSNVNIVETGNMYGNMNTAPRFYPENVTKEYRTKDFLDRRIILGYEKGFDGHKVFMADQKDKTGTYHILTNNDVEKSPNGWSDINEDILIITNQFPGIVAGHPVADCPVVMLSDMKNGITAVCHCSAELVDKKLPLLEFDALQKASKDLGIDLAEDRLKAYISSCAGPNWTYDSMPKWATDEEVWKNSIIEVKSDLYTINIRQAVLEQLSKCNIENVSMKLVDTITNPNYYSNCASYKDKSKAGRNFVGAFYPDPDFQKILIK